MNFASILTSISSYFVKRFRVTILLIVAIVSIGTITYTSLLKREGFPSIDVPVVIVRGSYFADDKSIVDEEATKPIESALNNIEEITEYTSSSADNFTFITAQFNDSVSADEGKDILQEKISSTITLPEEAEITYQTIDAGSIDGEHDLVFFLSDSVPYETLLDTAIEVKNTVETAPEISTVNVIEQFEEQLNPFTGETVRQQTLFGRVGFKENSNLQFQSALALGVHKKDESIGTLELSDAVRGQVDLLKKDGTLTGYTVTYGGDFADSLRDQISSLENNALSGLLAVVVVLLLFLNFRSALATAIFIPIVLAATFISLYVIGYTLNTIVLFSLILILGLFVDDAIVVVEAIDKNRLDGKKGLNAVKEAISSIGIADVSGTITTVLVFVPMLFISGILGDFIELIPITVIIALILSLIVALTIVPFVTSVLLLNPTIQNISDFIVFRILTAPFNLVSTIVQKLGDLTSRFVNWYLHHAIVAILVALVGIGLVGYGASFAQKLNFSVFPKPKDADVISMNISFPEGTTINDAIETTEQIENRLMVAREYITAVHYFEGSNRSAMAQIELTDLNTRNRTAPEIIKDLNVSTQDINSANVEFSLVSAGPPASEYQFAMQIFDEDLEILDAASDEIVAFLQDQNLSGNKNVTEIDISSTDVIRKRNGAQYLQIQAKLSDTTDTALSLELEENVKKEFSTERLRSLGLQEDALSFDFGQESENLESFNSTIFALGAAVIVMYALLVVQFNSFNLPLLILLAVPMSFLGLFPGLYVTNNALSFFVMLGVTGLVGIVVNNSIMLIDITKQARDEGMPIVDAIASGVKNRFRPIITTSTTTIAGLLPLALTDPFWEPLAFSIIFGLISSSVLVLTLLPVFYAITEAVRSKIHQLGTDNTNEESGLS